jgi:hypothetical protein
MRIFDAAITAWFARFQVVDSVELQYPVLIIPRQTGSA